MSENYDAFLKKFDINNLTIYESKYWRWSIRPLQCTVGAGILSLIRPAETLKEITEEEGADFSKIVSVIENTLSKCYNQQKMNYIMLMMVDNHVHYHVIPRYDHAITINGIEYGDECWPKPPVLDVTIMDENTRAIVFNNLKDNIVE